MYKLFRVSDNIGAEGGRSYLLYPDTKTRLVKFNQRPKVGCGIVVGTHTAWWQTTLITKICVDMPYFMHFKTLNSEYIWIDLNYFQNKC